MCQSGQVKLDVKESPAFRDDVTVNNIGIDMHRSLFRTSCSQDFAPALEPSTPGGLELSRMEQDGRAVHWAFPNS